MRNVLRQTVQTSLDKKADKAKTYYGYLGNQEGVVAVPNKPSYVFVTLSDGMVMQAYNTIAPLIRNLPVICGYDPRQARSDLFRVLDVRDLPRTGKDETINQSSSHHASHEWLNITGGTDVVYVHLRQFMPLRPEVVVPYSVKVNRAVLMINDAWTSVGNVTTDLSSYIPAPASGSFGNERFVLLSLSNTSGSIVVTAGSMVPVTTSTTALIPTIPTNCAPICAVRLYSNQELIVEGRSRTDLIDMRWGMFAGVATGVVAGTYNQVVVDKLGRVTSGSLVQHPMAKAPVANFYLTGYDATSGSFSSGSVVGGGTSGSGGTNYYFGSTYVDQTGDTTGSSYGQLFGDVDGANTTFVVSQGQYLSESLEVYRNGLLQVQGSGSSANWVETSAGSGIFDFSVAPLAGDVVTAVYKLSSGSPIKPLSHDPIEGNYLTGYDAASGSFSSGSVAGGTSSLFTLTDVAISGSQLNGQVLTWISGSAKWAPQYKYRYDPDDPPATAYAEDDEFFITSGSLNPKWTVNSNNAADTSFTQWPSWVRLRFSGNQAMEIVESLSSVSGSANFSITAHFSVAVQSNYLGVKIYAMDATKANMAVAVWEFSTNSKLQLGTYESSTYTWNRVYTNFSTIAPVTNVYLHLQRTSNAWFPAISFDGRAFFRTASTYSKTFTPAYLQIRIGQEGATIPTICGVDWIRVNWLTM